MDYILLQRVKNRLSGEEYSCDVVQELVQTITDRLNLRLGTSSLPAGFESIAVDATVKAYRRIYYEGLSSESYAINTTASFYEDILKEYDPEITAYLNSTDADGNARSNRVVKFL